MRKRQEIRHLGLCLTARRRQLGPGGGSRRRAGVCGPRPVLLAGWSPWGGGTGPCCPQPFLRPPLQAPLWASPQSQQHVENTPRPHARPVSKFLGVGAESPGQPGPGASSPSDRWVTGHWSPQGRYTHGNNEKRDPSPRPLLPVRPGDLGGSRCWHGLALGFLHSWLSPSWKPERKARHVPAYLDGP